MAELAKPGLLDLEKELTCSVRLSFSPIRTFYPFPLLSHFHTIIFNIADAILSVRYAPKSSTSPSHSLIVFTLSVALVSKNGSHGKPLRHPPADPTHLHALHAARQSARQGQTRMSLRCWSCTYKQIQERQERSRKRKGLRTLTLSEKMCCPRSGGRRRALRNHRTDELWKKPES